MRLCNHSQICQDGCSTVPPRMSDDKWAVCPHIVEHEHRAGLMTGWNCHIECLWHTNIKGLTRHNRNCREVHDVEERKV